MSYAIGVDVGGTNLKSAAISQEGRLLNDDTRLTSDMSRKKWASTVRNVVEGLIAEQNADPTAIGLAAPGLAARDSRSIAWMQGRLDTIQDLDWTEAVGLNTPIRVLNDGHAALLGEIWQGAASGAKNAVLLTLGTGVGGAIVCDGRLLCGHLGRAGHLGHLSLLADEAQDIVNTPGSLENAIGECTLWERSDGRFETTAALVAAYEAGEEAAREIWLRSVYLLACGIASVVNAVDPEVVVLGGGIAAAGPALFEPLQTYMNEVEWRPTEASVKIVPAQLGGLAGAYGAAYYAIGNSEDE